MHSTQSPESLTRLKWCTEGTSLGCLQNFGPMAWTQKRLPVTGSPSSTMPHHTLTSTGVGTVVENPWNTVLGWRGHTDFGGHHARCGHRRLEHQRVLRFCQTHFSHPLYACQGQCTDPAMGNFDSEGIPLIENVFEIIEAGDPILNSQPEALGMVKVHQWVPNPQTGIPSFEWRTGCSWWPYQRPTFVTPPFAGYVSGHSTFSRAAAEVLAYATGSEYFPGGLGTYEVEANNFLAFESGPTESFTLQWATYRDGRPVRFESNLGWNSPSHGRHPWPNDRVCSCRARHRSLRGRCH